MKTLIAPYGSKLSVLYLSNDALEAERAACDRVPLLVPNRPADLRRRAADERRLLAPHRIHDP